MDNQIAAGTGFYPTYPLGPEISHNLKFAGGAEAERWGNKQECAN